MRRYRTEYWRRSPGPRSGGPCDCYPAPSGGTGLLFSAKESIYKAWYPVARRPLEFEKVSIAINPDDGTFAAQLLVDVTPFPDAHWSGRWRMCDGRLVTSVTHLPW